MKNLYAVLGSIVSLFLGFSPSSGEVTTDGSGMFDPLG
jgi:hypothetical protein